MIDIKVHKIFHIQFFISFLYLRCLVGIKGFLLKSLADLSNLIFFCSQFLFDLQHQKRDTQVLTVYSKLMYLEYWSIITINPKITDLKVLANEDTLLPTQMFPCLPARSICYRHKFCDRDTKNVS